MVGVLKSSVIKYSVNNKERLEHKLVSDSGLLSYRIYREFI